MNQANTSLRDRFTEHVQRRFWWISLALVLVAVLLGAGPAHAKTVTWSQFDVDLTLRDDGSFRIEETQTVDFSGGPFSFAFIEIPRTRSDAIENIDVSEIRDGEVIPYRESDSEGAETYSIDQSSSSITINWFMPRTSNMSRTFVIAYDVIGGLRVYQDADGNPRQQIWWDAITEDVTGIAPVRSASFEVHLPEPVDMSAVIIDGPGPDDPAEHSTNGQDFAWEASDMGSGDELIARIEFPSIVNAAVPAWQQADDEQRLREQDREARSALLKLTLAAAGVLTGIAGGVGLFGLWYTRGRDPGVGAVADYLSEPPDDLPPGAAGALVDEYVNQRDIVATLTDLGHRGVLGITEKKEGTLFARRDYEIELKKPIDDLRPFEKTFVSSILGSTEIGAKVDLGNAKGRFGSQVGKIEKEMYEELVKRGYFPVSPESTRSRYRGVASTGLVILVIAMIVFGGRLIGISPWVLAPLSIGALVFAALYVVAKVMPRKTYSGAETAAKWRAFKRYLSDLDKNRATEGANELFEKFLPYAVAFGIERNWVQKFAEAGAAPPGWFGSAGPGELWGPHPGQWYGRPRGGWGGWVVTPSSGRGTRSSGGGNDMPNLPDLGDVQDASRGAGKSLQSLSGGLFELLDLAGSAFESFGSSGSRGGIGGSRHGGFSGGGRIGGGGGGGRRGFG